ncbi:thiamine-monophosphate kinase [Microbacterium faecale]|uniref:Thiamine-monophosphate kinase n=1 Tax=Microbacterium faecale TaxID=1804630 RepID=A0A916YAD0_9MICO|nr:thiamine-phosphate kinase [Microbacterium faecale]GGD37146.1 thiamine-monophosphate kinase [Microbacterium faecale]
MSEREMVRDLSEGEILRRILARTGRATVTEVGPGDDAAVLAVTGSVVATTDTLVDGPDFRREWSTGYDLGWKAAAVNLADVAAMGARATSLLVALAVPGETPVGEIEAMADGLREACDTLAPGCAVVGGDLTQSSVLTIAVTALGDTDGRPPVLRSGARSGDVVAIAGDMGVSARGLDMLFERYDGSPPALDELRDADRHAVERHLRPRPPLTSGPVAAAAGATAMMDVSDGLALDASRIADASNVTLDLHASALGDDPSLALRGGEDHALLATFPPAAVPADFREIGRVLPRADAPVTVDGSPYRGHGGWDPYRDWSSPTP